ncbi:restriction endonuclease subunit M [Bordetella sp. H567]|uniref:DNA adenine methylase n=1 Tax=Bordetella sp. H567 TaxID=1697043 RepID=UPI00081C40BF|nr:DNA adenine methylase [Bordetella sp. H567]AOB29902.1 restriction endonuclease subunit M [Bordetella sp. H567]
MATPIIPWIGGKRRLADRLLPYFPPHECYVEPFAGGAAMYFMRPVPADVEVINDVNQELVNLYRVVKHHLEELVRQFKWAFSSREIFRWHQITPTDTLTDIQRAARFFYLQQSAFGGKVQGQTYGVATTAAPGFSVLRIEEMLSAAWMRLANTYIENLPWQECVRRYDRAHTFFFMDPPYWQTEGYGVGFEWAQYEELAETLRTMKGKAMVTLNDHPDIRALFRDFTIESTDIKYTVGGGAGVDRSEVVIFSWDTKAQPASLF